MSIFSDPRPRSQYRGEHSTSRAAKRLRSKEIDPIIQALELAKEHMEDTGHEKLWLIFEYHDNNGKSYPTKHYYECETCIKEK